MRGVLLLKFINEYRCAGAGVGAVRRSFLKKPRIFVFRSAVKTGCGRRDAVLQVVDRNGNPLDALLFWIAHGGVPVDRLVSQIIMNTPTTEIVDGYFVYGMRVGELGEALQVLTPVVIGVGNDAVSIGSASGERIEVGNEVRAGQKRFSDVPWDEKQNGCRFEGCSGDADDRSYQITKKSSRKVKIMACPALDPSDGDDVHERNGRQHVSDADVKRTVHAVGPIKNNERKHGKFGKIQIDIGKESVLERIRPAEVFEERADSEQKCESEQNEGRQWFLVEKNDREILPPACGGNFVHEIAGVAPGGALDDH